jgi:SAM-dependent methyltransferase
MNKLGTYLAIARTDMHKKADDDYRSYNLFINKTKPYISHLRGKSILDIGCGRFAPISVLLHSQGYNVIGIDSLYIGLKDSFIQRWWKCWSLQQFNGLFIEIYLDLFRLRQKYNLILQRVSGINIKLDGLDIRRINAENLLFPENSFDIVFAVTVFEHIAHVEKASKEICKVLRKDGIVYLVIDLYTGISGSHNPLWYNTQKVPPWDHLRQQTSPLPTFLNKLRLNDYISIFKKNFEILYMELEEKHGAKELLTPDIRAELAEYSENELLSSALFLILRKVN